LLVPCPPTRGRPRMGDSFGRGVGLGRRVWEGAGPLGSLRGGVRPSGEASGATGTYSRVGSGGLGGQVCPPSGGVGGAARTYSEAGLAPPPDGASGPPGLIPGSGPGGSLNHLNEQACEKENSRKNQNFTNMTMHRNMGIVTGDSETRKRQGGYRPGHPQVVPLQRIKRRAFIRVVGHERRGCTCYRRTVRLHRRGARWKCACKGSQQRRETVGLGSRRICHPPSER